MSRKKKSRPNKCSFCGCTYETFSFKHGYVCDGCLQYIKSNYDPGYSTPEIITQKAYDPEAVTSVADSPIADGSETITPVADGSETVTLVAEDSEMVIPAADGPAADDLCCGSAELP